MPLSWKRLEEQEISALWPVIAQECRPATFFHTPAWARVLQEAFPNWSCAPLGIEYSDGNSMVMPMMRRRYLNSFVDYHESMPPGVYGGPLFRKEPGEKHLEALSDALDPFPDILLCGSPYCSWTIPFKGERRPMTTHRLDLTPGFETVYEGFRKGCRGDIKAARKSGVLVQLASIQELEAYYELYKNSLQRWGSLAAGFYPKDLFRNLFLSEEYGKSIKLWVASLDGNIVAGAWLFYHNECAVYWHGAAHSSRLSNHPVHSLIASVIEEACRAGFRWFDFNPSGGLRGVEAFKEGFGARLAEFLCYRRLGARARLFRIYRRLKQRFLRQCPL